MYKTVIFFLFQKTNVYTCFIPHCLLKISQIKSCIHCTVSCSSAFSFFNSSICCCRLSICALYSCSVICITPFPPFCADCHMVHIIHTAIPARRLVHLRAIICNIPVLPVHMYHQTERKHSSKVLYASGRYIRTHPGLFSRL